MKTNNSKAKTVLFTHYGDNWVRGSERCLLDLLCHLDRIKFRPVVWCNSTAMSNEVSKLKIPVILSNFPKPGRKNKRFTISNFFRLIKLGIKLIDTYDVKLIHANSGSPNQWLNFVARSRQVPLLTHLHSLYPLRDRVTLGLHHVAMTVGVSNYVINPLLQDGIYTEKVCVIPNGIDTVKMDQQPRIDLRNKLQLDSDNFLIATTGSLIHRKGMDIIISSIHQLINQNVPAHLVIIGDGPEFQNLQNQIQQLGIEDCVHLLGEQTNVAGMLRGGVDLFVSAAREEAFGLVLAEASLAQLAIVATNVGGIPDVVIHEKTGLLTPSEDVTSLTQCINKLYINKEQRKAMGKSGRRLVLDHFTIQHNVNKFEQLYNQLLKNPFMRMHWTSHWQLFKPFIKISKQLLSLALKKYHEARA